MNFWRKTISDVCRRVIKNKKTHCGKDYSTGGVYESRDSLQTSPCTVHALNYYRTNLENNSRFKINK
jgi:hypothetical protein